MSFVTIFRTLSFPIEADTPLTISMTLSFNVNSNLCTFFVFQRCVGQARKVHETITFMLVTLPNIHRFYFFFTHRLSSKPFLIWLLTTPSHLKYVATLPCDSSLMACFSNINVQRGSVATYARCDGIFNFHLTANFPRNLPVKKFKSVKI